MQNKCSHQISIWFIRIVFSHNFYGHTPLECYLLLVIHFGWAKCPNGSSNKKKNLFRKNICFFSRATLYQRNAWLEWLCMIRACIVELIFMFSNNSERFHVEYVRFNSLTWFSIRLPAGYLSKCKWFLLNARCHICRLLNCWEQTATTNFGSVRNSTSFFILVFFFAMNALRQRQNNFWFRLMPVPVWSVHRNKNLSMCLRQASGLTRMCVLCTLDGCVRAFLLTRYVFAYM